MQTISNTNLHANDLGIIIKLFPFEWKTEKIYSMLSAVCMRFFLFLLCWKKCKWTKKKALLPDSSHHKTLELCVDGVQIHKKIHIVQFPLWNYHFFVSTGQYATHKLATICLTRSHSTETGVAKAKIKEKILRPYEKCCVYLMLWFDLWLYCVAAGYWSRNSDDRMPPPSSAPSRTFSLSQ